jgi:hypothetical protein
MSALLPPPGASPLEFALHYGVDRGWPVLPLYPVIDGKCQCPDKYKREKKCKPGKHPYGNLTHGVLDATTEPVKINRWWGQMWPNAGVAVALKPANLLDIAPDSETWRQTFVDRGLPPTLSLSSGGGPGHEHHLYERAPGDPVKRLNKSGQYDIMSDGYAIVPPTVHELGPTYAWLSPPEAQVAPTTSVPWAVDMLRVTEAPRTNGAATPPGAASPDDDEPPVRLSGDALRRWHGDLGTFTHPDQTGNGRLFEIACDLRDAGATRRSVRAAIEERDAALGWNKFTNRTDGAVRYDAMVDEIFDEQTERVGAATARARANGTVETGWGEPILAATLRQAPTLDLELFAPTLAAHVRSIAWRKQGAPDYARGRRWRCSAASPGATFASA